MAHFEARFIKYQDANRYKNYVMLTKYGKNPRIAKSGRGWVVTFERKGR